MSAHRIRAIRSFVGDALYDRTVTARQTIFIAVVSFLLLLPYTTPGGAGTQHVNGSTFQVDEGTVLYDSLRVAHGQVPYRDFFEFPGPITFFLFGTLFRFVGPSLESARWLSIGVMALGAALVAAIATRLAGRLAGFAAALIQTCAFVPSFPYAYTHWIAAAAGLTGLLFIGGERPTRRNDFLGGACCAIALLTVQSVGLPLFVAAVGTVWLRGAATRNFHEALRRPMYVLLGGISIFGAVCFYFAVVGGLRQFLYCTWIWPLGRYALAQRGGMQYGYALDQGLNAHANVPAVLRTASVATLKFIVYAPVAAACGAVVAALWAMRALIRRQPLQMSRVIVAGMCLAAIVPPLSGRTRADVTHIAFIGSFGVLGLCAFLSFCRQRPFLRHLGTTALVLASVTCTYAYSAKTLALPKPAKVATFREQFDREFMQNGMLRPLRNEIDSHLPPNEPIVVGLMSGYYHFFFHPTELRITRISNIKESEYYTEEQIRDNVATIVKTQPKVIAFWTDYQFNTMTSRAPELQKMYHPYTRNIWVLKRWADKEGLIKPPSPTSKTPPAHP
jgi:hypothetical protein